jgi:hypothetical protein
MGWKNVKEHYGIGHMVCVTEAGICIGSAYVHDIIVVKWNGTVVWPHDAVGHGNEDLQRYHREMTADPEKLRELIDEDDTFARSIPVYTYDMGEIVEKECEEPGWPNVTHDGCLMYENLFSTDRATVVEWAKRNAAAGLRNLSGTIVESEKRLAEQRRLHRDYMAALLKLMALN